MNGVLPPALYIGAGAAKFLLMVDGGHGSAS
jgi:hypothetical protein